MPISRVQSIARAVCVLCVAVRSLAKEWHLKHADGAASREQSGSYELTLRSQQLSNVGRQEWIVNNTRVTWKAAETAFVIVDMWNEHWCESATTRVGGLAPPMNQTIAAARAAGVSIIFAPSDCADYYKDSAARKYVLNLENVPLPPSNPKHVPAMPLDTSTNAGCDVNSPQGSPWTHQIDTLTITDGDAIITSTEGQSEQELINVIRNRSIKNLVYMGVHENMCIVGRPFAIEKVVSWGWGRSNCAVMRELVDVMYTPNDRPYVSHADGVVLQTAWIEKFLISSVSMYDFLVPSYKRDVVVV